MELPAELKEYEVLLPYPKQPGIVELIAPRRERLTLREAIVPEDPSSSHPKIIPLFNGYSPSGDVTAPLVYVNYGLPPDYEALKKLGVDVKGKIAIVRYGNSFRGVKAKVAEDNGAVGLIIYSDPADDGYGQGDVYPKGPWRPVEFGATRISSIHLPGARRSVNARQAFSAGSAETEDGRSQRACRAFRCNRFLTEMRSDCWSRCVVQFGPGVFREACRFPITSEEHEHVKVHLKTQMDYQVRKIWNVIARIDGTDEKDRWVIMGNHRDAWTFGAVDPNSGTTAMLEAARGFGSLLKQGWKPRRTIVLCSWDAEEYGLVGSTEWAEEYADELKQKAVAYLNMDAAVSGSNFGASSVPSMWKLIRAATRDTRDPKSGKSVYQSWQDRAREQNPEAELTDAETGSDVQIAEARIGALGSGSDYTPFLQHLGVPSIDMGFGGDYGVYHSAYDSFYWMSHFGDPTFAYHVAAAQLWGTVALRMANADGLQFDYRDYATQIRDYFNESMKTARRRKLASAFDERVDDSSDREFCRGSGSNREIKTRDVD